MVAGACYNGTVVIWDVLSGSKPIKLSPIDNSHHDPVTSVSWL
jgi:dynein intermediate chain 2, axonemal